jgi:hypothetical protein
LIQYFVNEQEDQDGILLDQLLRTSDRTLEDIRQLMISGSGIIPEPFIATFLDRWRATRPSFVNGTGIPSWMKIQDLAAYIRTFLKLRDTLGELNVDTTDPFAVIV